LFLFDGIGYGGGKTTYERRGRGMPPKRVLMRTIVVYAQFPARERLAAPTDGAVGRNHLRAVGGGDRGDAGAFTWGTAITLGGLISHA